MPKKTRILDNFFVTEPWLSPFCNDISLELIIIYQSGICNTPNGVARHPLSWKIRFQKHINLPSTLKLLDFCYWLKCIIFSQPSMSHYLYNGIPYNFISSKTIFMNNFVWKLDFWQFGHFLELIDLFWIFFSYFFFLQIYSNNGLGWETCQ